MDYQKLIDGFGMTSVVVSLRKMEDGSYGDFRLLCGNKAYVDSVENDPNAPELKTKKFIPNLSYETYIPKEPNFETAAISAGVYKKPVHSYVFLDRFGLWMNMFFLPLESEEENKFYCIYSMEFSKENESEKMTGSSQKIASDVLDICIKLRSSIDFEKNMKQVLNEIRLLSKAKYCCTLLLDQEEKSCSILAEDYEPGTGVTPKEIWFTSGFYDVALSWRDTLKGSNCIIAANQSEMDFIRERNPAWYKSLIDANVQSLVLFPLYWHDELLGYIWETDFNEEDVLLIKQTLETTTFFISSEVANQRFLYKLKRLSSIDVLTGVFNRNEMNIRVDGLRGAALREKVGIVFCDLNGLKTMNDKYGHEAGDDLLVNAARVLKEVFSQNEIYRAGGDEFMVLVTGADQAALDKKVAELKELSQKRGVSFAAGAAYEQDADITSTLKTADERMYEDKQAYYAAGHERGR